MAVLYHTPMGTTRTTISGMLSRRWWLAVPILFACVAVQGCLPTRASRTPTTVVGIEPREPELRVRLARIAPGEQITIGDSARISLRTLDGVIIGETDGPLTITADPTTLWVTGANSVSSNHPAGIALTAAGDLLIEGKRHPGWIEAIPAADNGFELIAELALESYLPGVLEAELPSDWAPATFQAQAICARGYAIDQRRRARRVGRSWDVTDTVSHQVYAGRSTNSTILEAVASTRGRVLTFEGELLPAYYSAVCGGRNAAPGETWGGQAIASRSAVTPLDARPRPHHCQHAPRYRWSVTRSLATCSKRLAAWGTRTGHELAGIGTVTSITAERINAAGRPIRYVLADTTGARISIRAEQLRIALNHTDDDHPLDPKQRVHASDLAIGIAGTTMTIEGRGFGHGVGLCQHGAQAMATDGASLDQILALYYPGAALSRIYD